MFSMKFFGPKHVCCPGRPDLLMVSSRFESHILQTRPGVFVLMWMDVPILAPIWVRLIPASLVGTFIVQAGESFAN